METRVEIFRDGLWRKLRLSGSRAIFYNAVINRIGKIESREISHTNTFSLPNVWQNQQALGLNNFNASALAKALNSKHQARYYIEDKLLQKGYVVVNNTREGEININFIGEGLEITDDWGSNSFNDILLNIPSSLPADMVAAINEIVDYDMDKTSVLTYLTEIGARGYNLALFPNNLNVIGDLFQRDDSEARVIDAFNPYQSRPIFNARAFYDLACEAFGYTAIYDPSVDWDLVSDTYIVSPGLNENQRDDGGILSISQPINLVCFEYWWDQPSGPGTGYEIKTTMNHATLLDATRPIDIPGWVDPPNFENELDPGSQPGGYLYQRCVYVPRIAEAQIGTIEMSAIVTTLGGAPASGYSTHKYIAWENATPGGNVLFTALSATINADTTVLIDITIDKTTAFASPPGASNGKVLGIIIQRESNNVPNSNGQLLRDVTVVETYIPGGVISYDEFGQYISNTISLRYAAPYDSIKKVMSGLMIQQGILMNIYPETKEIKFFSYGNYQLQKEAGNFSDWSKYLLKYNPRLFNTDYGNEYAKKNTIGLTSPYVGNTFDLLLSNQGVDSKYKDAAKQNVKLFKDISKITKIGNTTPHFEYENKGLGLVEQTGTLGSLSQQRADGTIQGNILNLPAIANVNYGALPAGVTEWYRLVDEAFKGEFKFLLPVEVMRTLDLSEPIYVGELGGYFIIEEVAEYTNAQTPVTVKLIKLIDNLI